MSTIQATVPMLPYPSPLTDPATAAALEVEDAIALDDVDAVVDEFEPRLVSIASVTFANVTPVALLQPPDPPVGPVPVTKLTAAHCENLLAFDVDFLRLWLKTYLV
jgi:hypothetical protein